MFGNVVKHSLSCWIYYFNINKELNTGKLITVKNPLLFQFNVRELCGFAIWTVYFWGMVLGVSITANRLAMRVILLAWFDSGSKGKC